jgi:hypothetical protein
MKLVDDCFTADVVTITPEYIVKEHLGSVEFDEDETDVMRELMR